MRAIGLILLATSFLSGCAGAGNLAGSLPGNPLARFGFSTDDKATSGISDEKTVAYEVQVASLGGIIIPLHKPVRMPIADTPLPVPTPITAQKNKQAPPPAREFTGLSEAQYYSVGLLRPVRKPPPSMLEMATRYKVFRDKLRSLSAQKIDTPRKVRAAYKSLSAFNIETLSTGWYAHVAVLAMDTPAFQRKLQKKLSKQGRQSFLLDLSTKPAKTITRLQGPEVTQAVVNAIAEETSLMTGLSAALNDRARRFQRSRWGMAPFVPQPIPAAYSPAMTLQGLVAGAPILPIAAPSPISKPTSSLGKHARPSRSLQPVLSRILALAARISIGAAEGDQRPASDKLIHNKSLRQCLNWAALNMKQCTAAAAKPSEWAYCTAKHSLEERAHCWSWLVSYDTPI